MPAARATASIETAWKPSATTIAFVASSSCSRRCSPVIRVAMINAGYRTVTYGNVTSMDVSIAIVGSGFSGLGLAVRLRRAGLEDFVVLERGDGVGGTWHYNTYPGCACDVPVAPVLVLVRAQPGLDAHLLPAARDPRVPRARGRRVRRATEDPAEHRGDRRRMGRGRAALAARYTSQGEVTREGARLRHRARWWSPRSRTSPGSSASQGPTFHSARWDHDVDLRGKRVASDRHRRVGDPVRPARSPPTSSSCTCSSARRRG